MFEDSTVVRAGLVGSIVGNCGTIRRDDSRRYLQQQHCSNAIVRRI
jgi:hypothetical protein